MALGRDTVRHIALLARLDLTADEVDAFGVQLGHILEHFERLSMLDTAAVPATAHVVDVTTAFRDDVISNPPAAEELRVNAPARDGNFFKVPKIIE